MKEEEKRNPQFLKACGDKMLFNDIDNNIFASQNNTQVALIYTELMKIIYLKNCFMFPLRK